MLSRIIKEIIDFDPTDRQSFENFRTEIIKKLNIVKDNNTCVTQANLRARIGGTAAITKNKMSLRKSILDNSYGSAHAKDILKGTSLLHPNIFGPVPESKNDVFKFHNTTHYLRLKKSNTGQVKRSGSAPRTDTSKFTRSNSGSSFQTFQNPRPSTSTAPQQYSGSYSSGNQKNTRGKAQPRGRGRGKNFTKHR